MSSLLSFCYLSSRSHFFAVSILFNKLNCRPLTRSELDCLDSGGGAKGLSRSFEVPLDGAKQLSRVCHPFERGLARRADFLIAGPADTCFNMPCHSWWLMMQGTRTPCCDCLASIIFLLFVELPLPPERRLFSKGRARPLRLASSPLPRPLPPCPHGHAHPSVRLSHFCYILPGDNSWRRLFSAGSTVWSIP